MTDSAICKHSSTAGALVTRAALALLTSTAVASADPAGWALNWQDDFNGTAINAARWERLARRDSFNNEKQYYLANQATVGNGNLRITATNQPFDGKAYRSGLVRTWQEQTYGRWEVRASLPTGQGMWPAIWLLPRNVNWPLGGEIDIMENRGSAPTVVGSAYHYGPSVAGHQWVAEDYSYNVNGTPVSFHNSMHTYAVEWDPSRIRYLVDGVPHFTFYQGTAPISSSPMSLILNLAVGGDYGGDPNATTAFPQNFDIDYVNVYNRNNASRGLENGNFESAAGEFLTDWNEYSNAANVRIDSNTTHARTGSNAIQMYGRFNGNATNNSGLYQEVPTVAGEVWQLGAFARNRPGDALAGANTAGIKIEFVDANGNVINAGNLDVVNSTSPNAYRESVIRRVAPTGAVFARAVLEMVQRNNAGGAVNFDDATFRRVTGGAIAGDINLDGTRDSLDLDALLHSLTNVNLAFDFDANSQVNQADVDSLLASAFGTVRGDVNLDQHVDFDDLLTLAQNYGRTDTASWAVGDLTGDSRVTFDDLLALAQHYGQPALESELSAIGAVASDWQLAVSLVPEPSTVLLAALFAPSRKRNTDTSRRRVE